MFVILTNTHMWKVKISIILEGSEYTILSMEGFIKVTQQGGRDLSTFLFPLDASTGLGVGYIWLYNAFSIENKLCSTVFGHQMSVVGVTSDSPLHFQLHCWTSQDDLM